METWKKKLQEIWIYLTIKKKIDIFVRVVFFIVLISIIFDFWVVSFSLNDFRAILEDNSRCSEFMDAIENEATSFRNYIKLSNQENYELYVVACDASIEALEALPFQYSEMSAIRYAQTWSIQNSYESYAIDRDALISSSEYSEGYIVKLYRIYDMQGYLETYAKRLQKYTIEDGNAVYYDKVGGLIVLPFLIVIVGGCLFGVMVSVSRGMNRSIIDPIINLAEAARKIAANDFYIDDVHVTNRDEIGELVRAFNKMKYATGEYIAALEERRNMLDLIHQDELEKIEAEKNLERMNLLLLKSQINPHFLFNTLNVIGGMAKFEDAETTEEMIRMLSSIFRYNLKTPQNKVLLEKEIQVVNDYMYLQQMRFGKRISYQTDCKVDATKVTVPSFLLQPLVENAILHGVSRKVEGGKIHIRIWEKEQLLHITVADTGEGMDENRLKSIQSKLLDMDNKNLGIGLSNVCKRIKALYKNGSVNIYSKKDVGTVIQIMIPIEMGDGSDVSNLNS